MPNAKEGRGPNTATSKARRLLSSSFVRSVGMLVSGTVVAQAINFLALLVSARLYSPENFNVLAVFSGLVGWAGALACLRYELAIPLPKSRRDALALLSLSLLVTAAFSTVTLAVVLTFPHYIAIDLFRQPELLPVLWLAPIAILGFSAFSALQMYFVREKRFARLASSKVAQASANTTSQIGLGLYGLAPAGLLIGFMANTITGAIILLASMGKGAIFYLTHPRPTAMLKLAKEHQRLPKYSTAEVMVNGLANQLPIFVIAATTAGADAGFLMLAITAMQAPIGLFGAAIAQVYTSRMAGAARTGQLGNLTLSVFDALIYLGAGPLLFVGILAPQIFSIAFGDQWHRSGELVSWMTPWILAQFLAVPLSMAYYVTQRQALSLGLQVIGCAIRLGSTFGAIWLGSNHVSETFSLGGAAFYGAILVGIFSCTGVTLTAAVRVIIRRGHVLAGWVLLGITLRQILA
jgi:O-antigen/teichoic acid export membrane protein